MKNTKEELNQENLEKRLKKEIFPTQNLTVVRKDYTVETKG